jgi:tetratricopeptide (TPR) repeat protein
VFSGSPGAERGLIRARSASDGAAPASHSLALGARTIPTLGEPLNTYGCQGPADTQPAVSFESARDLFLKGELDDAARLYEELAKDPEQAVRAACGRAEVDRLRGDYEDGVKRLMSVVEKTGTEPGRDGPALKASAEWHLAIAALLAETGQYEEAIRHSRRAFELEGVAADLRVGRPENVRASWQLGALYEYLGRDDEAVKAYRLCEQVMTGGALPNNAEELTCLGQGFVRYSTLARHEEIVRRTRHVLQEVYQEAFHFVDPLYWPARLAAAELLLSKHNLREAGDDFEAILQQNPKVAAAHVGLGRIALENWDFEAARKRAAAALEGNPKFVPARLLLAETLMTERHYDDATAAAREALATNPNSIEALSVLAAAQLRLGDRAASLKAQEQAARINPRSAVMHHTLGLWLSAGRQFPEAEGHFQKAIEFAPAWPEPRTELGLLYMETGEEASARTVLEESWALDSFNDRTFRVLDLLDTLDQFGRIETEHFILKFDQESEGWVAPYVSEALEEMYPDICAAVGFEPAKRTIVEMFPSQFGFSMRIATRPFVATVGACSGRVIAMTAPRAELAFGRFNWKSVLRHEFTHTVTLEATENRIPLWFTEGLAQWLEQRPRALPDRQMLTAVLARNRLFTLDDIEWGFMRPQRPDDRGLAYAQGQWMVDFILGRYGKDAITSLLRAFRDGLTQTEAFRRAIGVDAAAFEQEFRRWAADQVAEWGLTDCAVEEPDAVRKKLEDRSEDVDLLVRLARAELLDGEIEKAEDAARKAFRLLDGEAGPGAPGSADAPEAAASADGNRREAAVLEVICHILIVRMLQSGDLSARQAMLDRAEPYIRRLHELEPENATAIKYLGYIAQNWQRWPEAVEHLSEYQRRFPDDPDVCRRLAAVYTQQGRTDAALAQLERLFDLVQHDMFVALKIASLYRSRAEHEQARTWFLRAIQIDPYEADAHERLGEECLALGRYAEAEREYRIVAKVRPDDAIGYQGLSRVYEATGRSEEAAAQMQEAESRRGGLQRVGR